MTNGEALVKLQHYCAYQDRCHQEVRSKLLSIKVYGDQLEQVMASLIADNYLNEERFARSFARGKYRIKKWGHNRIRQELKMKNISDYCIRKAMKEVVEEGGYEDQLKVVLEKYIQLRRGKWPKPNLRQNAIKHAISKGYEYQLITGVIDSILDTVN